MTGTETELQACVVPTAGLWGAESSDAEGTAAGAAWGTSAPRVQAPDKQGGSAC